MKFTSASMANKIEKSFIALNDYLEKNEFSGYEYDDLLGSKFVSFLSFNSLVLKIIAVQIAKRSVINPRKILGVKKLKSSKAFGFIVKGYLYYYLATKNRKYLNLARQHLSWLKTNHSEGFKGISWGNDFDFASRAGFFPKGLPTIVWSSHISEAFDFGYSVMKDESYKGIVLKVADFIENSLERIEDETGICFAYAPGIVEPIHNSNLLGSTALLRAWKYTKNGVLYNLAKDSIRWSTSHMNGNGSWPYGEKKIMGWKDNYHTGYVLDCLSYAWQECGQELVEWDIISETYDFWKNNFFLESGIPKFYHNKLYPIDIQAAAQSIESLAKYSVYDSDALDLAWRVANWTVDNMQKKNGAFKYRRGKYWVNNLEPIHWGQATMLSALGCLLYYSSKSKEGKKYTNG